MVLPARMKRMGSTHEEEVTQGRVRTGKAWGTTANSAFPVVNGKVDEEHWGSLKEWDGAVEHLYRSGGASLTVESIRQQVHLNRKKG